MIAKTLSHYRIVDKLGSPTLTVRATQMGMIVGTAAYMAPETVMCALPRVTAVTTV